MESEECCVRFSCFLISPNKSDHWDNWFRVCKTFPWYLYGTKPLFAFISLKNFCILPQSFSYNRNCCCTAFNMPLHTVPSSHITGQHSVACLIQSPPSLLPLWSHQLNWEQLLHTAVDRTLILLQNEWNSNFFLQPIHPQHYVGVIFPTLIQNAKLYSEK